MSDEVALLLVSHSKALAAAAEALSRQAAGPAARIMYAAGAGEDGEDFGTNAVKIAAVLEQLDSPSGTLVLMDIGSALLSAETALDLLDQDKRGRVALCAAPFIEGALAASVAAAAGFPLARVRAEAETALLAKRRQLGAEEAVGERVEAAHAAAPAATVQRDVVLSDPAGLHLRPAARVVDLASRFNASITIAVAGSSRPPAPADSLTALIGLGTRRGSAVRVAASGREAARAVESIAASLAEYQPHLLTDSVPVQTRGAAGVAASPGIAIGPPVRLERAIPSVEAALTDDPQRAWDELNQAINAVAHDVASNAPAGVRGELLRAQCAMLRDPRLLGYARGLIEREHLAAAPAWSRAISAVLSELGGEVSDRPALDIRDVSAAVLRKLLDLPAATIPEGPPAVLIADDLTPSEAASLGRARILGVIDRGGGPTSHTSILLRAAGIPAVVAARQFDPGETVSCVALDGSTGDAWADPPPATLADLQARAAAVKAAARKQAAGVAMPRGAQAVELWANAASRADSEAARHAGACGIGLLRSEFLFLRRTSPPGEDEQVARLAEVAAPMGGRPIVMRALDVGADKPLPFLRLGTEANPYLGVRGLRALLSAPEIFETQLRAMLRAAADFDLRIMLPMVSEPAELSAARDALKRAHETLQARQVAHRWPISLGIMVEVPAVALAVEQFAAGADFFSIGTNDLTQYTLAADRNNRALAHLSDAAHPAVLRLCQTVAQRAASLNRPVSVCGEAAGDPVTACLLAGLGITRLSMVAAAIPIVAAALESHSGEQLKLAAEQALAARDAAAARAALAAPPT